MRITREAIVSISSFINYHLSMLDSYYVEAVSGLGET